MPNKSSPDSQTFNALEDQLAATLRPVSPQHAFVQTVRQRISVSAPVVSIHRAPNVRSFMVVLTGVVSALALVAVGARVIFFLLTRSK
jgi:hypothetical protein